jgi:hypothetical protein
VGTIRDIQPVKLICGLTFAEGVDLDRVIADVEDAFGTVEERSSVFEFTFTRYYRDEMGDNLKKLFLSFTGLIHPGQLPTIKLTTNRIEQTWSMEGNRRVNLDPGYITGAKLVLASTKDFAHRVFLADGIYGDVQLQFRQNRFWTELWTFPDYQTDEALAFFQRVRKGYMHEERERD